MKAVGVRDLPGVGRVIADKLKHNYFTETCEDLQKISLQTLKQDLGIKTGQSLYNLCRGKDDKSKLEYDEERKSVSAEINYGIRFLKMEEAEKFLFQLCAEVVRRLHDVSPESNLTARQLTLKAMLRSADAPVETRKFMGHGICDSFSKSANFSSLTNDVDVIKREVSVLLKIILKSNNRQISDLRGLGIQLSKLEKSSKKVPSILSFLNKNVESATSRPMEGSSEEYKDSRSLQIKDLEQNKIETNNLSLSQIDPDTLDSMPDDIKEEILQNIKSNNVKRHSKISTQINGASHLEIANNHLNISYSEFDPNVLNELPIELQQELRVQFSSKPQLTSTGFDKIMRKTSSKQSTDQCSNLRSKKSNNKRTFNKSPKDLKQYGTTKTRAICKTSPPKAKQTLFGHNGSNNDEMHNILTSEDNLGASTNDNERDQIIMNRQMIDNASISEYNPNNLSNVQNVIPSCHEGTSNSDKEPVESINNIENESITLEETKLQYKCDNQAVLESETSIGELRLLIRKWVKSFVTPTYDDVESIIIFFKGLISQNKIELVHMGLKSLCRTCLSSEFPENWTGAYNGIIKEVQRTMIQKIGKRLSVNFKF